MKISEELQCLNTGLSMDLEIYEDIDGGDSYVYISRSDISEGISISTGDFDKIRNMFEKISVK